MAMMLNIDMDMDMLSMLVAMEIVIKSGELIMKLDIYLDMLSKLKM